MTITTSSSVVSYLDSGRVKVLLLPLSEFPDNSWESYLAKFSDCRKIEFSKFPLKESDDVILKKLGGSGSINYDFVTSIDSNTSDFIDFQLHQRIFGILGLIHAPSIEVQEISKAEEVLNELKAKFSYEIVSKVLIFDPLEKMDETFVTICTAEELKDQIDNFTLKIVENMSELFKDINSRPALPSPCGIEDYSGTASRSSSSKTKMRLSGRVQKLLADLHLLTGSYSEAVACYVSASEDAKAVNDSIWSAASQEGFNIALCLQNEQLLPGDKIDIYRSLIDKLLPLTTIYERSGTPILSIDLQITCSRVHRFIKQGSQALNVLSDAWKSCNLLAFDEKIVAYNQVLKEFAAAGNWRKWSLYMVQMAQTLKLAQKPEIALVTLSKTLSIYNLIQTKGYNKVQGWPAVQSALLKEMVRLSETHSNRLLYFLYGWMYLAYSNRWQDTADQVQIIENLKKRSMRDMFSLNSTASNKNEFICSLPIFVKLSLEKANNGLLISTKSSFGDGLPSGPFIYNPNATKSVNNSSTSPLTEDFSLISGEPAVFKLVLSNPFVFPIVLKNIYLITDDLGNPRLSEQVSITLTPMTKDYNVLINLIPENPGKLKVLGFCATFMNVEIQFLINSDGKVLENLNDSTFGAEFEVIEAQPLLSCSSEDLRNGLQLYEGESKEIYLSFDNFGSAPISKINFKIYEDQKLSLDPDFEINEIIFGNEAQTTFSIDSEVLNDLLPILPQSGQFKVPFKLFGTLSGIIKTGNLEIFYSSCDFYWRKLTLPLSITIFPVLKIDQFSFYPNLESYDGVLSKFANVSQCCCVGSLVLYNLDASVSLKVTLEVSNFNGEMKLIEIVSSKSAKRIFFLIPKISKSFPKKLPLNEKKIAAVRKLRKLETDDFLDDTFEDFIYDHDQFWIKKYLIDNLKINWEMFDDEERSGSISLSQCEIPSIYHRAIFKEHFAVKVDNDEFRNCKLGQEITIKFTIAPTEEESDFRLKLFPVVILNEREVALNHEDVIKYTGCLDSTVSKASTKSPQFRTFKFYPISTATVKIIYQLEEITSGKVYWCENPIIIETNKVED